MDWLRWGILSVIIAIFIVMGVVSRSAKVTIQVPRFQIRESNQNKLIICDTQNGQTISIAFMDGYEFDISSASKGTDCRKNPVK